MTIYYGRFLKANKWLKTGEIYYKYFNTEEAIYTYKENLRKINRDDILEAIGEMKFNEAGMLVENEKTERILYDPEGKLEDNEKDEEDEEDE